MQLKINNKQMSIIEIFFAEYRESPLNGQAYKEIEIRQGRIS
jgi:hypothetical protein